MKFGRLRPLVQRPTLRLEKYLRAALPTIPASCDFTAPAAVALRDIMGNDNLGDCVIAAGGHLVATETGNAGALYHATLSQIISQYSKIAGYVPGDPSTDRGTNVSDALAYWTTHGFVNGTRALGSISVKCEDAQEVKAAMWLFENLIFGVELPDSYVNPFPSGDGFTWGTGTPNPSNGHCFLGVGFDANGVKIDTWGMFGTFTYAAIAQLCAASNGGELHAILTPDQLIRGSQKAPNGVDWTSLISDFDSLGGTVPVPASPPVVVPPTPSPAPVPAVSVSLAQVEAWVAAGINSGLGIQTKSVAIKLANAQLSKNWPKS